jgi:hypothetical protein
MGTFYFNHNSTEGCISQWKRYINNIKGSEAIIQSIFNSSDHQTKSLSRLISYQTEELKDVMHQSSREQIDAINYSRNAICGTLEGGFDLLSGNLEEISFKLDEVITEISAAASLLDWKLSLLIEQQKINNLLSGNIAVLLRIPDIQKERQYYVEKGIRFFINGKFDNDFYEDSLSNFLKAENIEHTDYFTLHRIGLIYLFSPRHLNLEKAEQYFLKAAKYSVAETNSGSVASTNYLDGDVFKNLTTQVGTIDQVKVAAAESYLFLACACYSQGKFINAAEYAGKAFTLVPYLVAAGFHQAQALVLINKAADAAAVLEKVIKIDRYSCLKILSDPNLSSSSEVRTLLDKLENEATTKAKELFHQCKQNIIFESSATNYLNRIEKLIDRKSFLTSKKAIDLLEKIRDWKFCEPFKNSNQDNFLTQLIEIVNSLDKITYYKSDTGLKWKDDPFIDKYIRIINEKTQWIFPDWANCKNNAVWEKKISSKEEKCILHDFIYLEKKYNDNLNNLLVEFKEQFLEIGKEDKKHIDFLEKQKILADDKNYAASVGFGLLGGLGGVVAGLIIGFIIGLILEITSCTKDLFDNSGTIHKDTNTGGIIAFILMIIGGIIGFMASFNENRKK